MEHDEQHTDKREGTLPPENAPTEELSLDARIEALLFFQGEPVARSMIAKALETPEDQVLEGIATLRERLVGRGLSIMEKDGQVALVTASEAASVIAALQKNQVGKELGKAALETLAIVAYKSPIARSEIDYIRGVNSTFILRHLLIRGLVERIPNPNDQRSFLYRPTFDLLAHLGIKSRDELPEFQAVEKELADFEAKKAAEPETNETIDE